MRQGLSQRGQLTAYAAVSLLKRTFQIVAVIILIVSILNGLGIDVTAGLAALGIGGLAIALGAQKLFENLIGSLTLIADRPARVGDFCRFGDRLGTIEDIGMRSTRIRTLDRTVVTVPNGDFSALHIENFSARDRFLLNPTLTLRYETTPDQIRYLLQEIRAMLYAHPKVNMDPARIRFVALGSSSIDLEIFAYINARSYDRFLEVREDIFLRIMEIVAASGTGFAFPSRTIYMAKDRGRDDERARAAEDKVRAAVEEGKLQLPEFDPNEIRRVRGTIPYPPEGSWSGK